jgi:hypothetical protein
MTFLGYVVFTSVYILFAFKFSFYYGCWFSGARAGVIWQKVVMLAGLAVLLVQIDYSAGPAIYLFVLIFYGIMTAGKFFVLLPYHQMSVTLVEVVEGLLMMLAGILMGMSTMSQSMNVPLCMIVISPVIAVSASIFLHSYKNFLETRMFVDSDQIFEIRLRMRIEKRNKRILEHKSLENFDENTRSIFNEYIKIHKSEIILIYDFLYIVKTGISVNHILSQAATVFKTVESFELIIQRHL